MLLVALVACSNSGAPNFMGGGERHSEGVAAQRDDYNPWGIGGGDDTAGTDTAGTGADPDGPTISEGSQGWISTTAVTVSIGYTDPQDDVVGGGVYWDLTTGGDLSGSYAIVDDPTTYEDGTNALTDGVALTFTVTGADSSVAWTLGVTVKDVEGNQSNRLIVDIEPG